MWIVEAWILVAMIARAAVYLPVGLFLCWLALIVFRVSGGNFFLVLIGLWITYHAGDFICKALAGFAGAPKISEPSARAALRRAGMLGKR